MSGAWWAGPAALLLAAACAMGQAPERRLKAREILVELIEINTTDSAGDNTRAAEAMARRFLAAGFPAADVQVLGPAPRKGNLVVRYRGAGSGKPILFLAHLDVVEARREDWSFDPFQLLEKDGYFYGRGTEDDKAGDAALVTNFLRLKEEGFRPSRDLILALTSDEEGGNYNGADWLLKNHRDLVDAEYCINTDAGGGEMKDGRRIALSVQAAEKTFQSFRLEAKNRGGHSSLPVPDNAIYHLAHALGRIQGYAFPVHLNPVSTMFFERMSAIEQGQEARDLKAVVTTPDLPGPVSRLSKVAYYNAMLRTTCVATELQAGHAENALPQDAVAIVNCRLVPGDRPSDIQRTLTRLVADPKVELAPTRPEVSGPASPIPDNILKTIENTTSALWPGVPVVPVMETGATDGKYFRIAGIPTYGVSGYFYDVDDVRAHGKDERIGVESYFEGIEFYYGLIRALGR